MFFDKTCSEKGNLVNLYLSSVSDRTTIIVSKKMLCLLFLVCRLPVGTPHLPTFHPTFTYNILYY